MTNPLPAPNRWRPWAHRTRRGADLALAVPLSLLETAWLVLDWMFGLGMEVWAAQGDKAQVDAATLAHINRVWVLLVAVLIVAVLAGLFRAPWTAIAHLLVALLAGLILGAAQHQWDTDHAPSPGCIRYSANC
jgi:xanthine/uracil permease